MIKLSEYKKDILKLFTGTSISQIIPLVSSPILTRLYEPNDFGVYATFLAFSAVLSIIATLRLEIAIVIPEDENKSDHLIKIIFLSAFSFSLIIQIFTLILFHFLELDLEIGGFVHLLSVSIFVHSVYNGLYYLILRRKKFRLLAGVRIISAIIVLLVSIIIPHFINGATGLILATIFAYTFCAIILFFASNLRLNLNELKSFATTFLEFKKFTLFDLPSAFLIQLSNRLPIILLSNYFPIKTIGYFSLTQRMLDIPTSFVTSAVSDTFKQKAAEDYNKNGNCLAVFYETRKLLFYLAIIPYLVIQFFSPTLFSFIFGIEWSIAGEYAQILAFMFFLRFIVSPLTYTFYIREKMKTNLIGQFIKFLSNLFALIIGVYFNNIKLGLILFAITNSLIFVFYYLFALKYAK